MSKRLKCVTPVDGSVYATRRLASGKEIEAALASARSAQRAWAATPAAERARLIDRATDAFVAKGPEIAKEISWQMGRPAGQTPSEVRGFEERARHMAKIAPQALGPIEVEPKDGFKRFISRDPLGLVFVVAPWNYPYLTAVNAVVPALLAGNAVILRHSAQTPLCAERFAEASAAAGLPKGLFQFLHLSHAATLKLIGVEEGPDFVAFTGSVSAGYAVQEAAARRFIGVGLELGGKDPAYVRADANLAHAIENLVDGAFFNAGQSCCGIERIYVHQSLYDRFVEGAVALTRQYRLGNPLEEGTNLGPLVRASAAEFVRGQVAEAVAAGARALIDPKSFPADEPGTPYMAPQIVVGVEHSMRIMSEETFGPAV
ncbi:MAG: aldehyde dehydrogenase family protein, partial [Kiloniellales bacterium]